MKTTIEEYTDKRAVMPLKCWDIFSQFSVSLPKSIIQDNRRDELNQLLFFAKKYNWENDLKTILKSNSYEALVLTDVSKNILWVNDGFTKMTGYSKEFARNKQPSFLQGKNSEKKRAVIRKKLSKHLPFKEIIVNYKKDGTPYNCEIHVIPLKTNKTTHYLALERAV